MCIFTNGTHRIVDNVLIIPDVSKYNVERVS